MRYESPSMNDREIAVAGSSGDVGRRITKALVARGAKVRALVRPGLAARERETIEALGASLAVAEPSDVDAMAKACAGVTCVVSALNGLRDVIVVRQGVLLDAAVKAGVPKFIPSDYASDFTKSEPGSNRNFDLHREFFDRANGAKISVTSILSGAFMELLDGKMPLVQSRIHRVLYWHDADQELDFTTKDDVASYVAAAALDDATPRILRIAGDVVSVRDIAAAMSKVTHERYVPMWVGTLGSLEVMIRIARFVAPQPGTPFPPWQGMQYMRDQFSGRVKLSTLDNGRYSDIAWTSVETFLGRVFGASTKS